MLQPIYTSEFVAVKIIGEGIFILRIEEESTEVKTGNEGGN